MFFTSIICYSKREIGEFFIFMEVIMKNASLYAVFFGMILSTMVVAMEGQTYPWYQSYKNPAFRKAAAERWQTTRQMAGSSWEKTKQFVVTHKKELAAIAALIGITLSMRAYSIIFNAYGQAGILLPQIRKENLNEYRELIQIGIVAYAQRGRAAKSQFMATLQKKHTFIYEKYTPNLEHALWNIMR